MRRDSFKERGRKREEDDSWGSHAHAGAGSAATAWDDMHGPVAQIRHRPARNARGTCGAEMDEPNI